MNQFEKRAELAKEIRDAVRTGAIETASRTTLTAYSTWLCNPLASNSFSGQAEYAETCELVRLHMLRTMIDAFEQRSKIMQRWLLFFAVLAILATLMPYFIPIPSNGQSAKETTGSVSEKTAPTTITNLRNDRR